ncbi:hypothetical protein PGTUg99_007713 [Puccinia graminis f. sp. tritici]|uniref:Uncharacterized protein n=1 Tax=Puccinia graminis f. sp. tritici TaxID=56615 RepID=A0A5B0M5S0_PUCGR|nr:hypothetical protein PGTUg99_007713 [Puccinia graminis f. sp. tritici]
MAEDVFSLTTVTQWHGDPRRQRRDDQGRKSKRDEASIDDSNAHSAQALVGFYYSNIATR